MATQAGRGKGPWIACLIVAAGIVGIALLAGIYFFTSWGRPVPVVKILKPGGPLTIESGDVVVLVASGESNAGIQRIEFLANDLPANEQTVGESIQNSLEAAFPWFSSQTGIHKLSVIAYDRLGTASPPESVLVEVSARGSADAEAAGEAPAGAAGEPSQGEAAGADQSVLDQLPPDIEDSGDFPLDIDDQPQDSPPDVTRFSPQTSSAGDSVQASLIVTATDDLGVAYVTLSLASLDDPANVRSTLTPCGGAASCEAAKTFTLSRGFWLLSAQATDTSGQASPMRYKPIPVLEGGDPAGWGEGDDSNFQLDPGLNWDDRILIDTEPLDDIGQPRIAEYHCSDHVAMLGLTYVYQSDHGDSVFIGARAESDGTRIAEGTTVVRRTPSGQSLLEMTVFESGVTTEQVELFFVAGNDYFYTETADLRVTWPEAKPDLRISQAGIVEGQAQVQIENLGCAPVSEFDIKLDWPEGGTTEHVDTYLGAGETRVWNASFGDLNLLSQGFKVVVDPEDTIAELDEYNNSHQVPPIQLQYVRFNQIWVDSSHDGDCWTEGCMFGEFYMRFWVGDMYGRRPTGGFLKSWPGSLDLAGLGNLTFSPTLEWNQDLIIRVEIMEDDDINADDHVCDETVTLSHDIQQPGNWKTGGPFTLEAPDRCTLRYEVVSE